MLAGVQAADGNAVAGDFLQQRWVFGRDALAGDDDLLLAGVQRGLADDLAILLGPGVPYLAVDHVDQRVGDVVPQGEVLLAHRVQLGAGVDRQRVLLAVHRAAGQRRLGVGPAHLRGVGAQRREGVDVQRRAHDAQLQALHVGRRLDFVLGVAELAIAVFAPGQRHHAGLFDQLEDLLADLALHQRVDGGIVRHQEGQREQVELLDLRRPVDGRTHGHVDHALADGGEFTGLVALHQRGARIDLDIDAALGALAHQVGPDHGALAPREGGAHHDGQLVFGLVVLGLGRRHAQRESGAKGGAHDIAEFHRLSPRVVLGCSKMAGEPSASALSPVFINIPAGAAATAPVAERSARPPAPGTCRPAARPPSPRWTPSARARCGRKPSG
ncbi:Uncharacterised protein [Bordetella pertussis]|nr:Uncharacterised protein [Bordetella pertussis]